MNNIYVCLLTLIQIHGSFFFNCYIDCMHEYTYIYMCVCILNMCTYIFLNISIKMFSGLFGIRQPIGVLILRKTIFHALSIP